ncbi:Auxin-responsive protein-like protein [Quillaja saponaria]|uniref:Auxin-responsive protein-like protein n=1 Tax=Quillaja saponaria TaxID=32244 RepID=A0AAD7QD05_QUISA|nr:Auxin-responsive protein-like protein [Quillaja saponaria]
MDDHGSSKLTGIRQIVKLKEMLHKWQSVSLGSKLGSHLSDQNHRGIAPVINKRLTNVVSCDLEEDSYQSPEPLPNVPKRYLAVYVGPELRRFIIPTSYLSHSLFKLLLENADEEFGFDQD